MWRKGCRVAVGLPSRRCPPLLVRRKKAGRGGRGVSGGWGARTSSDVACSDSVAPQHAVGARHAYVHSHAQRSAFRTRLSADVDRALQTAYAGAFSARSLPLSGWLFIPELFKYPLKMSFVLDHLVPDPPDSGPRRDVVMTGTLTQLARLASLSTPGAWNSDPPHDSSQTKAKLWYEWAEACIGALPSKSPIRGTDLWTILRRKLCHWLRLKLRVLEYATIHLGVLAVDVSDHIVRRTSRAVPTDRWQIVMCRAGADSAIFPVFD